MYEHEHKFFVFKTFETFEQVSDREMIRDLAKAGVKPLGLYVRVEYAIINCNCGLVKKQRVE